MNWLKLMGISEAQREAWGVSKGTVCITVDPQLWIFTNLGMSPYERTKNALVQIIKTLGGLPIRQVQVSRSTTNTRPGAAEVSLDDRFGCVSDRHTESPHVALLIRKRRTRLIFQRVKRKQLENVYI